MPLNQRLIVALQHYILHCTKSNIFLNLSLIRLVTRFVGEKSLATAEENITRGTVPTQRLGLILRYQFLVFLSYSAVFFAFGLALVFAFLAGTASALSSTASSETSSVVIANLNASRVSSKVVLTSSFCVSSADLALAHRDSPYSR